MSVFGDFMVSQAVGKDAEIGRLREVNAELLEALEGFVNHGYCPNCGCDLWNTKGCPTCPEMRRAYDLLVRLGLREKRDYAAYMEADEVNTRNLAKAEGGA